MEVTVEKEYYDKLEKYYTKDETKVIIQKIIEFNKKLIDNQIITKDNYKSIIISTINDLIQDIITNQKDNIKCINITLIDTYLNQTPQERCPKFWEEIKKKTDFIEDKKNNIYTTDIYECFRCHKRRCTIEIIQTRSADEPATTFVNCVVCGNHWTT